MDLPPATPTDLATIAAQLGREPCGVVAVAARCPAGHPCSVVTYPVHRRGGRLLPFPTLYWLTCPTLDRAVARLEASGLIRELDARLDADPALATRLAADHRAYIDARWALLSSADRTAVAGAGLGPVLRDRGIGGLAHFGAVKCLHAHLAHHLAVGNGIGALLMAEFGITPCGAARDGRRPHRLLQ